jgi:hypothetical protein
MNKKLFPGFPQGDFGALREGVIKTANFFSEDGGEKNKKIANILSVLGDAMQNQQLYQEIYKEIGKVYDMYQNWWNREVYVGAAGGKLGSGGLVALEPEEMPKQLADEVKDVSHQGLYLLAMQTHLTKPSEQLSRMGMHPDFPEQLEVFNRILWFIYIAIFYPNGVNMISKIFISKSFKSGKNWA